MRWHRYNFFTARLKVPVHHPQKVCLNPSHSSLPAGSSHKLLVSSGIVTDLRSESLGYRFARLGEKVPLGNMLGTQEPLRQCIGPEYVSLFWARLRLSLCKGMSDELVRLSSWASCFPPSFSCQTKSVGRKSKQKENLQNSYFLFLSWLCIQKFIWLRRGLWHVNRAQKFMNPMLLYAYRPEPFEIMLLDARENCWNEKYLCVLARHRTSKGDAYETRPPHWVTLLNRAREHTLLRLLASISRETKWEAKANGRKNP